MRGIAPPKLDRRRYVWSSGADYGVFEGDSCEAFVKDLPLQRVAADVLIAYEMNGAPLRPEHGYPARLVVPGYYGTNSVKWLTRLSLAETRATGPFTTRWYNDPILDTAGQPTGRTTPVGPIAPESVIVSPEPDQTLAAGEDVAVWGWAWADGGVGAVDVNVASAWKPATIEPPAERLGVTHWSTPWRPQHRGSHELAVRAQSRDGRKCCSHDANS